MRASFPRRKRRGSGRRHMSDRGVVAFGKRFQREFSSPKSDFRFAAAEVVQLSVREFAVGRFERFAKQLAANADVGKINTRC